jgi:mRNA-degrading endonuclease RelE of RelBE toxin-antitoxin system
MNLNEYKIFIDPDLQKSVTKNLPECFRKVFNRKMVYFAENHHHPSLNTKKYNTCEKTLKRIGVDEVWEFYINRKNYRCIFYVIHEEKKIIIIDVGNHEQLKRRYA